MGGVLDFEKKLALLFDRGASEAAEGGVGS